MQDLLVSSELGKLLTYFHETGKPTALDCHGPIALLSTLSDSRAFIRQFETSGTEKLHTNWAYAGHRFTVFSNQEEEMAKGLLGGGAMNSIRRMHSPERAACIVKLTQHSYPVL